MAASRKARPMRNLRAVLFDLDGTLLDIDMETFLPEYFRGLSARVEHILPHDRFVACLMQATKVMMENDGQALNAEVFSQAFYPLVGRGREELEPIFQDFYARDYPKLRKYSKRKPEARRVVQTAFELGCDVVIATTPLFPATAIEQRMQWAGVEGFPYRLVTSYENSRAAKPNLRYYRDIVEGIGHAAERCLMVGNEPWDMVAARIGCPTFLVTDHSAPLDPAMPEPAFRGSLSDLERLLRRIRKNESGRRPD